MRAPPWHREWQHKGPEVGRCAGQHSYSVKEAQGEREKGIRMVGQGSITKGLESL